MGDFFDKSFQEQIKCIVQSGDLKLQQTFIGIRNPIGLLQYYTSFISAKISMEDIKLHGEYKLKERCLTDYMERMEDHDRMQDNANSNLTDATVSDISKAIKGELLTKLLLRESNAENKTVASICNTDYMCESISDRELVSYTRNTEINSLCVMDAKQADAMYDALVQKSHVFLKKITENHPYGSPEQKNAIKDEIRLITRNIPYQEHEIAKYRNVLKQIKQRSFLKDWYNQLESAVIKDAKAKSNHTLHEYFPKDERKQEVFIEKLKDVFIAEVVSRLLKEIVSDKCSKKQFDNILNILKKELNDNTKFHYLSFVERTKERLMEEMTKPGDALKEILQLIISEIKPEKVVNAEQSVLDDILFEAASLGKQECALLLICNGADINLEREKKDKTKIDVKGILGEQILDKPGLLVIKMSYDEMPSIKGSLFSNNDVRSLSESVVEDASQLEENCAEFTVNNILSLKEIRDIFPDNTIIKLTSDVMVECEKRELSFKGTYEFKKSVLQEKEMRLKEKKYNLKSPWIWAAAIPLVAFAAPVGVASGLPGAAAYIATYLGVFGLAIAVDLTEPFLARRNAQNELEIAKKDLERATEMFEVLSESLVAGNHEFHENCEKIRREIEFMKRSKEKWINFTNVLKTLENAQKAAVSKSESCFVTESVKFGELAEDIIRNRMRYMDDLRQSGPPDKSPDQTIIINKIDNAEAEMRKEREGRKGLLENVGKSEKEEKLKVDILQNILIKAQEEKVLLLEGKKEKAYLKM